MVGHLLEYHPGVIKLKEIADSGELGDIHYIYGNRLNLGKLRADENALWSLGAHDVSVVLSLVGEEPSEVNAFGESYMRPGIEDVVFCFLRFPSGVAAHLHLSWLDPHKERRFTVVGSKRMATFDDMSLERKIEIYDKGFDQDFSSYGEYIARSGDIHSPRISNEEPLRIECRHFVECIAEGRPPRSGPESGVRVVRVLEALQESLVRDEPCCDRLTARPGCCSARAWSCPTTRTSAPTSSSTTAPSSAPAARCRTTPWSASRSRSGRARRRRARRRRRPGSARARPSPPGRS